MSTFSGGIEYVTIICCNCSMPFALNADFHERRRNDHEWWYCPAGHSQHFTGKTEVQKLREELDSKQRTLEAEKGRALALTHQRDEIARAHKRMRDRVRNGVCPCCNRTFQNLMRHMQSEHPEFSEAKSLKVLRDAYGLTQKAVADEAGVSQAHISQHERGQSVPARAANCITSWIERNTAAKEPTNG